MEINIDKMNVVELKALAYDVICELEQAQNNLKRINNVIATKTAEANNGEDKLPKTTGDKREPERKDEKTDKSARGTKRKAETVTENK